MCSLSIYLSIYLFSPGGYYMALVRPRPSHPPTNMAVLVLNTILYSVRRWHVAVWTDMAGLVLAFPMCLHSSRHCGPGTLDTWNSCGSLVCNVLASYYIFLQARDHRPRASLQADRQVTEQRNDGDAYLRREFAADPAEQFAWLEEQLQQARHWVSRKQRPTS